MVQALGAIFLPGFGGTLSVFGVGLTTAAGGLTLAGSLLNIAGGAILNAAVAEINRRNRPPAPRPDNVQFNSKVAAAERLAHYGRVKAGGAIVFERAKEGFLYRVVVHGHGQVSGVEQMFLNNDPVTLDVDGFVTDDQYVHVHSRVQLIQRLGAAPDAHFSEITDVWPAWTEDHRLDGLWKTLLIAEQVEPEKFNAMYPAREPTVQAVAQSAKVYDPRSDTTGFSENLALCIADYMASPDGMNEPDAFEAADIIAAADIADQDVPVAQGGTEKRWRCAGSYGLNEQRRDVLQRMLDSGAARIRLKPNGHLKLEMGGYTAPTRTITYSDVIEVSEVVAGPDGTRRYNILPARYVDQGLGFVEVDADAWIDEVRIAADGGDRPGPAKSLLFSPSHRQARSAMKLHMDRENPALIVRMRWKPCAFDAIFESVVALDIPELGLSGDFSVETYDCAFRDGHLSSVAVELYLVDPAAGSLTLAEQGTVQTLPEPDTPSGVPLPQSVTAAGSGVQTSANTFAAGIAGGWAAAPSDALTPIVKITPTGTTDWQAIPVSAGATNVQISGLIEGAGYDLTFAFVTPGGITGAAVTKTNVVATAASTPPDPPTSLVVTDAGGGQASITLTEASSPGLWKTEIYRDAVLIATIYADGEPGSSLGPIIDACGAGTFDWTARSVNVSNINSATDAGPFNQTIA